MCTVWNIEPNWFTPESKKRLNKTSEYPGIENPIIHCHIETCNMFEEACI